MQMTIRDAARMLNLSERAVQRHVDKGEMPFRRLGGRCVLDRDELTEWATARGMPIEASDGSDMQMPSLGDAIDFGGVFHGLPGSDKETVLRNMVSKMPLPPDVEPAFLHGVLMAREALGTTAIGDGVAVPHPRSPILLRVSNPLITLCFLDQPIDFGALDGKPVHALFSVISTTTRVHLHLLSKLAYSLHDSEFKRLVESRARQDEIVAAARRVEAQIASGK